MKVSTENKAWRKFERKIAIDMNGSLTPGSGNKDDKGDVKTKLFLFDAKTTSKDSFRITKKMIDKYDKIAKLEGKEFALAIRFLENDVPVKDLVVLDYYTALEMIKNEEGRDGIRIHL